MKDLSSLLNLDVGLFSVSERIKYNSVIASGPGELFTTDITDGSTVDVTWSISCNKVSL